MLEYSASNLHLGITSSLAKFLSEAQFSDLDETAVHAGKRGVLDWLGCAMAGSGHPTLSKLIDTLVDLGGARNATVLFRNLKLGTIEAALVNGQMGHVLDYDDTHMGGVVLHNSSPTLPAIFALAERQTVSGRDLLTAYALAFEAGVRTGQAAPDHRKCGWHLTGTLGTFAAATATGRLLGLDAEKMTYALGIAGTQVSGMQQNRGTSCKSFHAGRAASNGLLAALLAQRGFDSSGEIIEGKRGFARIYSTTARPELVLDGIGTRWEISRNGHKPYACGVLLHPAIDAVIKVSRESNIEPSQVEAIELKAHPDAVLITGLVDPKTGLQSKFSISHTAAVAFIDRAAGITQYSDKRALSPDVAALRQKVSVSTDETFGKDQAWATVRSSRPQLRSAHRTRHGHRRQSDVGRGYGSEVPRQRGSDGRRRACARHLQKGLADRPPRRCPRAHQPLRLNFPAIREHRCRKILSRSVRSWTSSAPTSRGR